VSPRASRFGRFPAFRPLPEPGDVTAAAAVLRDAARPFILAGGGVLHSGAGDDLVALAERLTAAVGTTLSGKGSIAEDHPLSVGVTGAMGTAAAATALAEADAVLLAGAKASSGATFNWTLPRADQRVVQVDVDPAELGRAFGWAVPVLADAREGARALLAALGAPPGDSPPGASQAGQEPDRAPWRARLGELTAAWRAARDGERASDAVPIAPQRVLAEIEAALGEQDILICDASLASGWGGVYLEQLRPGRQRVPQAGRDRRGPRPAAAPGRGPGR
jgi:acetolactate synthase-1/2/3 large subunit